MTKQLQHFPFQLSFHQKRSLIFGVMKKERNLPQHHHQTLILHGHTNGYRFTRTQAHRDQHMAISRQRAERVRDTLVSMGVPAEKIQLEWFGDLRPVWAEVNGMTSQGNRRVEIFVKVPARLVTGGRSLSGN